MPPVPLPDPGSPDSNHEGLNDSDDIPEEDQRDPAGLILRGAPNPNAERDSDSEQDDDDSDDGEGGDHSTYQLLPQDPPASDEASGPPSSWPGEDREDKDALPSSPASFVADFSSFSPALPPSAEVTAMAAEAEKEREKEEAKEKANLWR